MLQYGACITRIYHNMAIWLNGSYITRIYHNMAIWQYGSYITRMYRNMAILQYGAYITATMKHGAYIMQYIWRICHAYQPMCNITHVSDRGEMTCEHRMGTEWQLLLPPTFQCHP
jgi:hypothetical protein